MKAFFNKIKANLNFNNSHNFTRYYLRFSKTFSEMITPESSSQNQINYPVPITTNFKVITNSTPLSIKEQVQDPQSESYLWAQYPIERTSQLTIPIYDSQTFAYTCHNAILPHSIFNNPIRKDLIHRVYLYNLNYNKTITKLTKTKGEVSGSNRKPHPQKKLGRARQGNRRAPHLKGGGKAHGVKPRSFYFPLNKKVRLAALKSMLTSKFISNKILVVNSLFENPEQEKNEFRQLQGYIAKRGVIFLSDEEKIKRVYKFSANNLRRDKSIFSVRRHRFSIASIRDFNVKKLLENEYLIFSVESLDYLISMLASRESNYFSFRKLKEKTKESPMDKYQFDFDVTKKLKIHTPALAGSVSKIYNAELNPEEFKERVLKGYEKNRLKLKELKTKRTHERMEASEEAASKKKKKDSN